MVADKTGGPKERIRLARTPVLITYKEAEAPPEGEEASPPEEGVVQWPYKTPPAVSGPVVIGVVTIHVPSLEEQQTGFELPRADARRLLAQFPDIYKRELARSQPRQVEGEGQMTTDEVLDTITSEEPVNEGQQGKGGETLDPEATADRTQEGLRDEAEEEGGHDAEKD